MNNFQRLIALADEVFSTKNDPDQLDVNEQVIEDLAKIHPSTVSEFADENGPAAWVLVIPTTQNIMLDFLDGKISEKELFILTQSATNFEAIYLCSALVLEEYRRQGIARKLAVDAISEITKEHRIHSLFVWAFSREGELAAEAISVALGLPLFKRNLH